MEKMLATDTENLAGGGEVTAQKLLDVLAEQVANKLLAKSQVVNNLLATVEGNPLDATQGKALKDLIDTTNNNLSNGLYGTTQDTTLDQLMKHMSDWNHPFVFDIGYTLPIAPDKNNAVGIGERGMLHAFSYSGKHFYCIDSSKGWQESPYALKSDLFVRNWITNPNTCATPFSVVNGWSRDLANVPDDAKNTWNSLQTTWVYPEETGDLTKQRLQTLITGNNTIHIRMYANGNFANWS